jgi:acyl carrier protein
MPGYKTVLTPASILAGSREIVARVLFVPVGDVHPESELIADLGAESIDFVDLVFQLEDLLGEKVTVARWDRWLRSESARLDRAAAVTVKGFAEFARAVADGRA